MGFNSGFPYNLLIMKSQCYNGLGGAWGDVCPHVIAYWADVCPWLTSIDQLFI